MGSYLTGRGSPEGLPRLALAVSRAVYPDVRLVLAAESALLSMLLASYILSLSRVGYEDLLSM